MSIDVITYLSVAHQREMVIITLCKSVCSCVHQVLNLSLYSNSQSQVTPDGTNAR